METTKLAQEARQMAARGAAKSLDEAIAVVVRQALNRLAGDYTARAERDWIMEVARVERATRV